MCWPENSLCILNALVRFCHHSVRECSALMIYYCNQQCFECWLNNKPVSEAGLGLQETTT